MTITKAHVKQAEKEITKLAAATKCHPAEAVCILFVGVGQESGKPFYGPRHIHRALCSLEAIQRDLDYWHEPKESPTT